MFQSILRLAFLFIEDYRVRVETSENIEDFGVWKIDQKINGYFIGEYCSLNILWELTEAFTPERPMV